MSENISKQPPKQQQPPEEQSEFGVKDVLRSVLSAAIGVQSRKNQERDFKHGKARVYVIAGVVFTLLFIATVFSIVTLVLKQAGH